MDQIDSEILRELEDQGLTISEGVAIDARLVKSASLSLELVLSLEYHRLARGQNYRKRISFGEKRINRFFHSGGIRY